MTLPSWLMSQTPTKKPDVGIPNSTSATSRVTNSSTEPYETKYIHSNGERTKVSVYKKRNHSNSSTLISATSGIKTSSDVNKIGNDIKNIFSLDLGLLPEDDLRLDASTLQYQNTISYNQYHNGIKVKDAFLKVTLNSDGNISYLNSSTYTVTLKNKIPTINANEAISICKDYFIQNNEYQIINDSSSSLLQFKPFEAELVYCNFSGIEKLAWQIIAHPNIGSHYEVLIDAQNSQFLSIKNKICHIHKDHDAIAKGLDGNNHNIKTTSVNNIYYMIDASVSTFNKSASTLPSNAIGAIQTLDAKKTALKTISQFTSNDNKWDESTPVLSAVSAQVNSKKVYNFFLSEPYNRQSIDGNGGTITSIVNVNVSETKGADRAFWNGSVLVYGNGDKIFKPLAVDIDIVAHEMTHGIVQHTAQLDNTGIAGAINEAYADIFAAVIGGNWQIGETALLNNKYYKQGELRNLANPNNGLQKGELGWMADHIDEFIDDENAIYENSGIISHAFYQCALNHPNGINTGKLVAAELFYNALLSLTPKADFQDVRNLVLLAAEVKYGVNSSVANIVNAAFKKVGIEPAKVTINKEDLPLVIGEDYIITKSTTATPTASGLTVIDGEDFSEDSAKLASVTTPYTKLSVTDDGKFAYLVNNDGEVHKIQLDTIRESLVSESNEWKTVAVSRKDNKLALVKKTQEPVIFIFDIALNELVSYTIPKSAHVQTSDGKIKSLTPLSIGYLEWNFDGDKLLFECLNYYIDDNNVDTHFVWDIGEITVWDMSSNYFSDGKVVKFFPLFPANLNMRNPTFAKNSPYIFVYDEMDTKTGINTVIGLNRSTNQISEVIQTSILANPTFSFDDKKLAINQVNSSGDTIISIVLLNDNKISASEGIFPITIAKNRQQPVWFSQGERYMSLSKPHLTTNELVTWPNPFKNSLNIDVSNLSTNDVAQYNIYNSTGKSVLSGVLSKNSGVIQANQLAKGVYILKIEHNNSINYHKVIKE